MYSRLLNPPVTPRSPSEASENHSQNCIMKELGLDLHAIEEHEKSLSILRIHPDDRSTFVTRNTPVVNSKYLPVWKRARAKLQM